MLIARPRDAARKVALAGLLVGGAISSIPLYAQLSKLTEGEPLTSLALPRLSDGSPTSLSEFQGQKLVLHIFASW